MQQNVLHVLHEAPAIIRICSNYAVTAQNRRVLRGLDGSRRP